MSSPNTAADDLSGPEKDLAEREAKIVEATEALNSLVNRTLDALQAGGMVEAIPMENLQKLLVAAVRMYGAQFAAGRDVPIFGLNHGVSATDAMVATTAMLKAVNIQLFELGMWQMWAKK